MLAIWQNNLFFILLQNTVILVSLAFYFRAYRSAISNFTHVDRVVHNPFNKIRCESAYIFRQLYLLIIPPVELLSDICSPFIKTDIQFKGVSDNLGLVLYDGQYAVFQFIPIWSETTIPTAVCGFCAPSWHGLDKNVLPFDFCHSRHDRNHQLTGISRTINIIFHTD